MSHHRFRHIEKTFHKALKFWPAVCLVGSRQVGKSTFLKSLSGLRYRSFDDAAQVALAELNPSQLLEPPCIIDEAQKVPKIFDAVKLEIDREKKPGKFILTGSVRFSKRTLIRESLTGRARTIQLFPLTCSETLELKYENRWRSEVSKPRVNRKDFQRYLSRGGMPAIFAARSQIETTAYWTSLVESFIYRDLLLAVSKNPKPQLASSVLKAIAEILALGDLPTFARIFKKTGGTRPMVERHVLGLEDMMLLHRIPCFGASRSQDIWMPYDPAFFLTLLRLDSPLHDSAIHMACMHITLINEALAHAEASDQSVDLHYAVSPKDDLIHLITIDRKNRPLFWKISEEPVPHDYSLRFLRSLVEKEKGTARVLSSTESSFHIGKISVTPWESIL